MRDTAILKVAQTADKVYYENFIPYEIKQILSELDNRSLVVIGKNCAGRVCFLHSIMVQHSLFFGVNVVAIPSLVTHEDIDLALQIIKQGKTLYTTILEDRIPKTKLDKFLGELKATNALVIDADVDLDGHTTYTVRIK